jgi:hypothetical protein
MSPVSRKRKKPIKKKPPKAGSKELIRYICLQCNIEEDIPKEVVDYCDMMDDGDVSVPPRFSCKACGGEMRPKEYLGVHGIKYEL